MKQYLLLLCLCFTWPSYAALSDLDLSVLKHLRLLGVAANNANNATWKFYDQIDGQEQELTVDQKLELSQLLCEKYRTEIDFFKYYIDHDKDIQRYSKESGGQMLSIKEMKAGYLETEANYQKMQKSFKGTAYECKS